MGKEDLVLLRLSDSAITDYNILSPHDKQSFPHLSYLYICLYVRRRNSRPALATLC